MKVICEERTYRQIPDALKLDESNDAWHPLKNRNYVEWWYFDVMGADGTVVRGQFYISGDVSKPRSVRTGVRATYVMRDGSEIMIDEKFPQSSFQASTEACDVSIGRSFIKGSRAQCTLHVEDSEKALDLELRSELAGFKSHACFGDETKCMHWVVPQPRGRATGTFRTRGESIEIEGLGYRDHNWLNFSPLGVVAHWDWGRVYDSRFTVIFADIVTTRKLHEARVKPLIIYDSEQLRLLTTECAKWSLGKEGVKFDPDMRVECPQTLVLKAADEDVLLSLSLRLEKAFQKIDPLADFNPLVRFLIRTFIAKPAITSFLSTGSGKLKLSGQENALTCTAVHELVRNS